MSPQTPNNQVTSTEEFLALLGRRPPIPRPDDEGAPKKRQKYGAEPVVIDGVRFGSKAEAERYQALQVLERAGKIKDLVPHPVFVFVINEQRVGKFTADSQYVDVATGKTIVEDVKGGRATRTEAYSLRKRLMKACFGIEVQEWQKAS